MLYTVTLNPALDYVVHTPMLSPGSVQRAYSATLTPAGKGINVARMRYAGVTISGALAGMGGYIYIATTSGGTCEGTVAGMGFLALAIMIFGNWKPIGIVLGSLLFGMLKCIGPIYSMLDINGDGVYLLKELDLPMYFYNMIPYVAVLIVLAFTSKKSRAPKAEGVPYDKGAR